MKKIFSSFIFFLISLSVFGQTKKPVILATSFRKDTFNIVKYGAKPDGITLNTKSINEAITACNKKGGGVVIIPTGMWLTGPIVLLSNVNLYLINCSFASNMADKDIYLVPTENIIQYGRRIYYYNSHRKGGDYTWHKDNLNTSPGAPSANDITVDWLFDERWKPQENNRNTLSPNDKVSKDTRTIKL